MDSRFRGNDETVGGNDKAEERYFKVGDVEGMARKLREFMCRPLSAEEKNAQIKLVAER